MQSNDYSWITEAWIRNYSHHFTSPGWGVSHHHQETSLIYHLQCFIIHPCVIKEAVTSRIIYYITDITSALAKPSAFNS